MSEAHPSLPLATQQRRIKPTLVREAFKTSRLIEFCNPRELVAQTGHEIADWPLVIAKELCDNALDACEEAGTAPEMAIDVSTHLCQITVRDNGPGIPEDTIADVLNYTVRVSSREAYASPTRGAQGNALKTLLAMGRALDGVRGETVIESRGVRHRIAYTVDQLRQEPRVLHEREVAGVEKGTLITIMWPDLARSILCDAKDRFLQIADDFAWLNPSLRISVRWNGDLRIDRQPSNAAAWEKWRACDPTSAHWYDGSRFERYIAAHVSRDQDMGCDRLVREFVSDLRGFSGSAKQKAVLDDTAMHRIPLSALFKADGNPDRDSIAGLLAACQRHSRSVQPRLLGLIGRDHLLACFRAAGVHEKTFKYQKALGETDGLPWIVETAFGYCPDGVDHRRIVAGVNFSVGIGNPFRSFRRYGGEGLEAHLNRLRAADDEPIVVILHYTCPRVNYTDRGKTALVVPGVR